VRVGSNLSQFFCLINDCVGTWNAVFVSWIRPHLSAHAFSLAGKRPVSNRYSMITNVTKHIYFHTRRITKGYVVEMTDEKRSRFFPQLHKLGAQGSSIHPHVRILVTLGSPVAFWLVENSAMKTNIVKRRKRNDFKSKVYHDGILTSLESAIILRGLVFITS